MQRIFAIITLTWKAAFRYRLFWVLLALLLAAVIGLPMLLKDDGSAQGFTQILLTYTLSAVTGLLGMCTLWLSCGTLARDIEECQIQMVAVKPIPRWQIWLGKWLGILCLNAVLLGLAGASIYGMLEFRARKLPPQQQIKLKNEVLVSRAAVKEENLDSYIEAQTEARIQERAKKGNLTGMNMNALRQQIREQVKADFQVVPPEQFRPWIIHLGRAKDSLKDQPLFLRIKFNTASGSDMGTYGALWLVGVPESGRHWQSDLMSLAPATYHEFPIPANLFDEKGDLGIMFVNPNKEALLFSLDDGLEVLYRQGGFGLNFVRGLGIIFCWMALLAALGMASASLLSFPVAAFFSLAILTMVFSSGTLANVISEGTIAGFDEENSRAGHSALDVVVVPAFRVLLKVINLAKDFSPIDALSTGRSISWEQFGQAFGQVLFLLGGLLAAVGIFIFSRRELATAQGTQ